MTARSSTYGGQVVGVGCVIDDLALAIRVGCGFRDVGVAPNPGLDASTTSCLIEDGGVGVEVLLEFSGPAALASAAAVLHRRVANHPNRDLLRGIHRASIRDRSAPAAAVSTVDRSAGSASARGAASPGRAARCTRAAGPAHAAAAYRPPKCPACSRGRAASGRSNLGNRAGLRLPTGCRRTAARQNTSGACWTGGIPAVAHTAGGRERTACASPRTSTEG